jgi:hypothetical protein
MSAMLDHWLDDYEARWNASDQPPDLAEFLRAIAPGAAPARLAAELAMSDLELRWRRFFPSGGAPVQPSQTAAGDPLPALPIWDDYAQRLALGEAWTDEGLCHEFRVRQLFGDRPDYRDFLRHCPAAAALRQRLPAIAAELTRGTIRLSAGGHVMFACRLPDRLEVGRRRVGEPLPPCITESESGARLLVADLPAVRISRAQFWLEVIAKGRILLTHIATKGQIVVNAQQRLTGNESLVAELPCLVEMRGVVLRIEGPAD